VRTRAVVRGGGRIGMISQDAIDLHQGPLIGSKVFGSAVAYGLSDVGFH